MSYPWLVGGDFSDVMDMNKRVGGNEPTVVEMLAMKNCMQDCCLLDLKQRTIDRVIVNCQWEEDFLESEAVLLIEA